MGRVPRTKFPDKRYDFIARFGGHSQFNFNFQLIIFDSERCPAASEVNGLASHHCYTGKM